ncbi:hypothetical protein RJ641_008138 [Dillenia turbinata]|uniref:F-box domain-containing protein n=1 Tax=Dillenia turbinata TaxID=194707 RepID=A0AAN8V7K6_9MAGN
MSYKTERPSNPSSPKKKPKCPSDFIFSRRNSNSGDNKTLQKVMFAMHLQSLSPGHPSSKLGRNPNTKSLISDLTLLLPDEIMLKILSKVPKSQHNHNYLVCKRWLVFQGRLVRSLKVLDWDFLQSGRLTSRFPNLTHVDLVQGCLNLNLSLDLDGSVVLMTHKLVSATIGYGIFVEHNNMLLSNEKIDYGLKVLASGCPNLRKFEVVAASELGLLSVAETCDALQELVLHRCSDQTLRGISAYRNLQVLKLIGNVDGFYSSIVSEIGLTILANGCPRLVKLELCGCEGSYDGIKALGQCCQMLEELTFFDHRMDGGWLAALSYCENLKTLRFQSCRSFDRRPGINDYLESCRALESLHLVKCQLREKISVRTLFAICAVVKEIVIQDCWGLDNAIFGIASVFRRVKHLSLEGCSLLTTEGLESVILFWKELESLRVVSCKNMKVSEVSPALSTLFSALKQFKWRPGTKSMSDLHNTGIGKRGRKFFKKS